ncbi:hypothetical protein [Pedobacter sp. GR22-6]|uniref:hypothetical protein n=1 Tax=Pedobacter sp. GR22-6 TaxID=3127957 RepID=UPI00307F3229
MEALYLLTNFINDIFIKSLFISILSIILVGKVFKADNRNAFIITKVIILIYAALNTICYIAVYFSPAAMESFVARATGPYRSAFYLMLVPNTLLPLSLLFKRLGRNKYVLLILSVLMNIGWIFELLTIYSTDMHRDYAATRLSFNPLWFILLNGIFIGSVIYAVGRAFKNKAPNIDPQIS